MKLNKLQRYTAYCILLQDAEDNKLIYNEYEFGICNLFKEIFGVYPQFRDYHIFYYGNVWFKDVMPELYKYKTYGDYWFNNWEERIEALKKCIEKTHP